MRILTRSLTAAVALSVVSMPIANARGSSTGVSVSVHDGVVGVTQTVSGTVTDLTIGGGYGTLAFVAQGQSLGSADVGQSSGETGSVAWTPAAAGQAVNVSVTFTPNGDAPVSDATNVRISQVNTAASITTPGTAPTSTPVTLAATVRAQVGAYVPTGTVTFFTDSGAAIGSSTLDGNGRAQISYTTPATPGNVAMYVVYNGDASAFASKRSAADTLKVVQGTPTVSLVAPQTNYAGSPVQLTAKITPDSGTGSVAFSANGTNLGTAAVANGVATITWTPPSTGKFTLKAAYTGGNGVAPGLASNDVLVNQALKPDQITVNPAGAVGPWPSGSTQGLANGAQVQLATSSASGAPVQLTVTGPCAISGNTLSVNGVGAPCSLVASSQGGNGFAPGSMTVTIVQGVGSQTATVNPAPSGVYRRGKVLTLAPTAALTNLGNKITWSVTAGRGVCTLVKSGGTQKVKLARSGSCSVVGTAPAVPGQWAPFTVSRDYTVQ